jgi:hypothetical protein
MEWLDSVTSWVSDTYSSASNWVSNTWDNYSSNAFACAQEGAFGGVAGICVTTEPDVVGYAGFGTPGPSGAIGTVVNGTPSDYLTGWSGGGGNIFGAGTTLDGTTALTLSSPGWSASATYGVSASQIYNSLSNTANDIYNQASNWANQQYFGNDYHY